MRLLRHKRQLLRRQRQRMLNPLKALMFKCQWHPTPNQERKTGDSLRARVEKAELNEPQEERFGGEGGER